MKNLNEIFGEYDETPQRRRGGYILSMETVAEARRRRLPDQGEFRSHAFRSPKTPRLDRMRNSLAIWSYMLEREAREERDG